MNRSLQIAMISTDYPPLRTSAAVQLRDLAQQFLALGHRPVMIVPSPMPGAPWTVERLEGIEVLRVAAPPTRAPTFFRRAIAETVIPCWCSSNITISPANLTTHHLPRPIGGEVASVRTPFRQARLSQHSACRPRIAMSVFQSPDLARIHPAMTIASVSARTSASRALFLARPKTYWTPFCSH